MGALKRAAAPKLGVWGGLDQAIVHAAVVVLAFLKMTTLSC